MNSLLFYLLQVMAASGLLYGYYHFALRNKRFHRYNRFYLLMGVVISTLIPFLNIPVYFSENETGSSVVLQTLQVISSPAVEEPVSTALINEATRSSWFTAERLPYLFYFLALSFFIVRVFISLNKIRFIIKRNPAEQIDKIKFINTDEPGTPFSFFRWLFWNRKIELQSEKGEQIFRHELFHIQQKHSWDIIFMELISTIFWINPCFHLIKKELKAIHEFLADEFAIKENKNWQYAELLLMQALNTNNHLVNPFFHNQIKRRIAMVTTSTKSSYQYLRKLMVFPVAAIIIFLFAFNYQNKRIDPQEFEKAINSIAVVIDAGHGGTDKGATSKNGKYNEADISLAIAKKIEALGPEYNVNVIMTRRDGKFPGGATNKNDALKERVELVNNLKPHAFVAIHMNTTPAGEQGSKSGFDAYISNKRSNVTDIRLATTILAELKNLYTTREEIKRRDGAGIFVIDKANAASLLLECGYMNNPKDISFITNEANQEKLARAILKGLVAFANDSTNTTKPGIRATNVFVFSDTTRPRSNLANDLKNALIVIDGIVQTERGINAIDSSLWLGNMIETVNFYKDKPAIDRYGESGKEGVIEIFTRKDPKDLITEILIRDSTKPKPDTIIWIRDFVPPAKKSPTFSELEKWADTKTYGIWLDGKRINNSELEKYKPSAFDFYQVSKLEKNAVNYGKHYYQVNLYTQKYYNATYNYKSLSGTMLIRNLVSSDTVKPKPLIVINGKQMPDIDSSYLEKIVPADDIENIRVLSGMAAEKKYGDKGKNGVIEIVTKKTKIKEVETWKTEPINDIDNIVFEKVEIEASFRGGYEEWKSYLERNLDKNIPFKNGCKPGTYTVVVQFIVGKDGRVSDVKALTNHGFGMEEEAVRMIKKSPDWVPAIQNGHNVKAYRKQPITFKGT